MDRGLHAACPDGLQAAVDTRSLHRIKERLEKYLD